MLEIEIWTRNSFDVEAVRVTEENIREVAEWCRGTVAKTLADTPRLYIAFNTANRSRVRESKAYVNDWVVRANGQFKHYHRSNSIRLVYHKKDLNQRQKVQELVEQALLVDIETSSITYPDLVGIFTEKLMQIVEDREDD